MMQDVADGTVIRNPQTGERRVMRGGEWMDVPSGIDATAPGYGYLPEHPIRSDRSEAAYYRQWRDDDNTLVQQARAGSASGRRAEGLLARQAEQADDAGFLDPARYSSGGTGGIYATPIIGSIAGYLDPEIRELRAIQARQARQNRVPGEGAISDFDAQQFLAMTYGPEQPAETNRALIRAQRVADDSVLQRRQFAEWFYGNYNTLTGVEEAWDRYAQDNPIFLRGSDGSERPLLNDARTGWREYFGAGGDARAQTPEADLRRAEGGRGQFNIQGADGRTHAITADDEAQAQQLADIWQRINPRGQEVQYFMIDGERIPAVSEAAARLFVRQREGVRRGGTAPQGASDDDPLGIRGG